MVLGWWILRMLVGKGVVPWFWNCTFSPPVVDRDRWAVLSSVLELKLSWFSDFAMFSHVSVVSKPGRKHMKTRYCIRSPIHETLMAPTKKSGPKGIARYNFIAEIQFILLMEEIFHQLRLVVYPFIHKVSYTSPGCRMSSVNQLVASPCFILVMASETGGGSAHVQPMSDTGHCGFDDGGWGKTWEKPTPASR